MSFKVYYFKPPAEIDLSACWDRSDAEEHFSLVEAETTLPVVQEHLPRNDFVLDAGCGLGRWVHYLRGHGCTVLGLDKSAERLTTGREYAGSFPAVCASVLQTPFPDEVFGAVISFGLVEHLEQGPCDALAELRRILKPGGLLLVSVPYNNLVRKLVVNPLYLLRNLKRRLLGWKLVFNEYRFSAGEMRHFMKESGFDVIACYPHELVPPKSIGLFIDRLALQGGLREIVSWELGPLGRRLRDMLDAISPWLCCGGVLCIGAARRIQPGVPKAPTCT